MEEKHGEEKACPDWADKLIECLRLIEVHLGNIPNNSDWQDKNIKSLVSHLFDVDHQLLDESKAQFLFKKIVTKLAKEKFTPEEITHFINQRIYMEIGPPYCSQKEVVAVIK